MSAAVAGSEVSTKTKKVKKVMKKKDGAGTVTKEATITTTSSSSKADHNGYANRLKGQKS